MILTIMILSVVIIVMALNISQLKSRQRRLLRVLDDVISTHSDKLFREFVALAEKQKKENENKKSKPKAKRKTRTNGKSKLKGNKKPLKLD